MRHFLLLGALAVGYCLTNVDAAHAQRWGRERSGFSVNTPGFSFSYGNPGWYGRGYGYGYPYAGWYGRGYDPYGWGYRPYYGAWYQGYPAYYSDDVVSVDGNQDRGISFYAGYPNQSNAELRVQLPDPNASLTIDGQPTMQRGVNRVFAVPPLTRDRTYSYALRATWMENGREVSRDKKVDFKPGESISVNFTDDRQHGNSRADEGAGRTEDRRGLQPASDASTEKLLMARIVRVDGNRIVLAPADGGAERTVQFADDGVVTRNGNQANLQQLRAEMPVTVTLRSGSPTVATKIEVREQGTDGDIKP